MAPSEHLSKLGVPHMVLERKRIAEARRSGRWDSLVANGPAWDDRCPGLEFDDLAPALSHRNLERGDTPDEFVSQAQLDGCNAMLKRLIEWLRERA